MKSKLYSGLILLALFFLVYEKTNAQSHDSPPWAWVKSLSATFGIYGNAVAIDPTGSGDVYVAGGFEGQVDFDPGPETFNLSTGSTSVGIFISKFDGLGNFVWVKAMFGVAGSAFAESITIDPTGSGAIYTTGHFRGTVDFDPGPNTFNLTSASAVCSGFPFCGDIFISKLDGGGNFVWAKVMGGSEDDFGSSIAIDPGGLGDVYTTGQFKGTVDFDPGADTYNLTSVGNYDIFISKLNSSGNFLWAKPIGGPGSDISRSIAFDPAGSGKVYTTGYFSGTVDFDPGAENYNLTAAAGHGNFISKIDRSGNFIWAKQMGRVGIVGIENAGSIALDPEGSGDVYTTGSFKETGDFDPGADTINLISTGSSDIFISKLNDSGNFKWAKAMGGTSQDFGTSIAIQPGGSGNVFTIGHFNGTADFDPGEDSFNLTSAGTYDIFISKLDSAGNFLWAKAIKGADDDISNALALDASGYIFMTGFYFSPSISFDSITLTNVNTSGADLFIAKLDTAFTTSVVNVDSKTYQIKIYPNPATNELTVEFDGDEFFNVDITLFNILGEVVFSSPDEIISHQKTIDISSLSMGIYFIELNIGGNRVMEKVVKE